MGSDLLSKRGISAEWELFASGPDIINAMEKGRIDLAYIGLPPVIIGISRGLPLVCIAGGHIEGTIMTAGETILSLSSCTDMLSFLIQFEGKKIGSPPKGSIHDIIIRDLLERYELNTISVVNYPWADFLPDAIEKGEIIAAVGTPALAISAKWYAGGKLVIQPEELWPFNPSYGIITTKELLKTPAPLKEFLYAHEEASEMIRHNTQECSKIIENLTGLAEGAFITEVYRVSPHYCSALPEEYIKSTLNFVNTLARLKVISKVISEDKIFHTPLINQVHPGPHHYRDGILT
jgi:NitT/TauT family transport system substrate-binding protein